MPILSELKTRHTWDQAVQAGDRGRSSRWAANTAACSRRGLPGRWCDRYQNHGKQSGAFSSGSFDGDPYILMNYQPDVLDHVFTLAHEAGHSMHRYYSAKHQPFQYYNYTIFVAEVASTFNEQLLSKHLMAQRHATTSERAFLINREIDAIRGTIIRQTMFAEFEKLTHALAEAGEPLTVDRFKSVYRKLLEPYFGPDFALDAELSLECLRIPHFYRAFYVYKYATGLSAAIALAERVTSGGKDASWTTICGFLQGRLLERSARSAARRRRRHGEAGAGRHGAGLFRPAGRRAGRAAVGLRRRLGLSREREAPAELEPFARSKDSRESRSTNRAKLAAATLAIAPRCSYCNARIRYLTTPHQERPPPCNSDSSPTVGRRLGSAHADQELPADRLPRRRAAHHAQARRRAVARRRPAPRSRQAVCRQRRRAGRPGHGLRVSLARPGRGARRTSKRPRPSSSSATTAAARASRCAPTACRQACRSRKTLEQIGQSLDEVAAFGEGYGVEIRLEIHGRGTSELPNVKTIMDVSKHPGSKVCWNCNTTDLAGNGLAANFKLVQDRLGTVHIHDLISSYPWQQLFDLLKGANFQGWTLLEEGDKTADPVRVMKYYRLLWERMTA